ncbi:hypothetical protein FRC00_009789 [Tulasnella sp. 408]|nr:hypothetical protein FRC00_009789 [Tulasnella sp. 408]
MSAPRFPVRPASSLSGWTTATTEWPAQRSLRPGASFPPPHHLGSSSDFTDPTILAQPRDMKMNVRFLPPVHPPAFLVKDLQSPFHMASVGRYGNQFPSLAGGDNLGVGPSMTGFDRHHLAAAAADQALSSYNFVDPTILSQPRDMEDGFKFPPSAAADPMAFLAQPQPSGSSSPGSQPVVTAGVALGGAISARHGSQVTVGAAVLAQ